MKNPVFQIRSSGAQFLLRQRFLLLDFSITYVFSIPMMNIPIPSAGTVFLCYFALFLVAVTYSQSLDV
jgi:hypothetical protein